MHMYGIYKGGTGDPIFRRYRCKEQNFWTQWEKVRAGFERIALKHVHYHM